jgi:hypothetical protein
MQLFFSIFGRLIRVHGYRSVFDSRRYQIFWEVVGLERGPLSLVSTTEELLERKSSDSGLQTREYGQRDPSCWPRGKPLSEKLCTNFADKRRSLRGLRPRNLFSKLLTDFFWGGEWFVRPSKYIFPPVIPFYLQSVLVHSANCVNNV